MTRWIKLVNGTEIEMTPEEIAQRQTEENTTAPLSLAEQLSTLFSNLPAEQQADLAPLKAAVKLELDQGHTEIARLIIARASIPAELEAVRTSMLDLFPSD
ncbi:MAG: hypothetical protein K0Q50_3181 [Vampirovibrio sp.]|jgi:hypothetical protein|nr:hypothetical protein [Vampirovibrio sp.]